MPKHGTKAKPHGNLPMPKSGHGPKFGNGGRKKGKK